MSRFTDYKKICRQISSLFVGPMLDHWMLSCRYNTELELKSNVFSLSKKSILAIIVLDTIFLFHFLLSHVPHQQLEEAWYKSPKSCFMVFFFPHLNLYKWNTWCRINRAGHKPQLFIPSRSISKWLGLCKWKGTSSIHYHPIQVPDWSKFGLTFNACSMAMCLVCRAQNQL